MNILDWFFNWFCETKLWRWISKNLMAHFTFRVWGYPQIPMESYFEMLNSIDLDKIYAFGCSDTKSLAAIGINAVVPSGATCTHAGFLIPDGEDSHMKAVHMKGKGLVINHPLNVLRESDRFILVEVILDEEEKKEVREKLNFIMDNKEKYSYDFAQRINNGDFILSCSELFYEVLKGKVDDPDFKLSKVAGRYVFSPDAVVASGNVVFQTGI